VYVSKPGSFWQCLKIHKRKILFSQGRFLFRLTVRFFRKYCIFSQILYFFAHFPSILANQRLLNQQVGSRIEILSSYFTFKYHKYPQGFLLVIKSIWSIAKLLLGSLTATASLWFRILTSLYRKDNDKMACENTSSLRKQN
jgi:hypothetical protein